MSSHVYVTIVYQVELERVQKLGKLKDMQPASTSVKSVTLQRELLSERSL